MLVRIPTMLLLVAAVHALPDTAGSAEPRSEQNADSSATSPPELDRMVVTATRTRRRLSETPASVAIIDSQRIVSAPARSIEDLLQYEAGVKVKRVAGIGEGIPSDIIMRGIPASFAATRMLVLVDGIPTNASGTPFLIINEVPMLAVKRVEVVRGPQSALYGANAFGGVVNILTREGDGPPGASARLETSFPFTMVEPYVRRRRDEGVGEWAKEAARTGLWNVEAQSSAGSERMDYLVDVGYRTVGNYLADSVALVKRVNKERYVPAENYDYTDTRIFGRFGYRISERTKLTIHTRYFDSDLGFGRTRNTDPIRDIITRGSKVLVGPEVQTTVGDNLQLRARGYYRRVGGEFLSESPLAAGGGLVPSRWTSHSDDGQVEIQAVRRLGERHVLTGGADFLRNAIAFGKVRERDEGKSGRGEPGLRDGITTVGVYAQDEISPGTRWRVVPGGRVDIHSVFGTVVSPKLAAMFRATDGLTFRASGGRAFRAPAMSELYMPDLPISANVTLVSNPRLEPEYIVALDAGAILTPIDKVRLASDFFYNRMEELVIPRLDLSGSRDSSRTAVTHGNDTRAWSTGVETDLEWHVTDWASSKVTYTWQKSRDVRNEVPLDYMAQHSASVIVRARRQWGQWLIEGEAAEAFVGQRSYLDWQAPVDAGLDTAAAESGPGWNISFRPDGTVSATPPHVKLDPYFRTDLSVHLTWKIRYRFSLIAQNLFNAKIEESGGTLAPRRLAAVRLGVDF